MFLRRQVLAVSVRPLFQTVVLSWLGGFAGLVLAAGLAVLLAQPARIALPGVAAVFGLMSVRAVLLYFAEMRAVVAGIQLKADLRHRLYARLLELGPVRLAQMEKGALTTTLLERVEACDAYASRYLPALAIALVVPAAVVLAVTVVSFKAALLLVGCGALLPVLLALVGVATARASAHQFLSLQRLGGLFHDRLQNLVLLRLFCAAPRETERLRQASDDFRHRTMKVLRIAFLSSLSLELLMVVGIVAGAMILLPLMGRQPTVTVLFALLLVPEFFQPLRALLASYHDRMNARSAAEEIARLLALSPGVGRGQGSPFSCPERPGIEFRNIHFSYGVGRPAVLQGFSLAVQGGEWLALAGSSGAGKSTLLHLLLGLLTPDRGEILIAGRTLDSLDDEALAHLFGWVGQRNFLFHGTLMDNMRLGKPEVTEDEVLAALELAQLLPLVESLPEGLQTVVGERGFGFSGGEAQRLALARAFLAKAPILLLDEPTAGLDAKTAEDLLAIIRLMARQATILMVTHDARALQAADRVVSLPDIARQEVA